MNKIRKVCSHCGSDDVRKDAWAKWDEDKQEWVVEEIYSYEHCNNCEGESTIIEKEINNLK